MNLFGITANKIAVVNPMQNVAVQLSTGNVTNADGSRTPSYATPIVVQAQVQELTHRDLRQLDALNIQGSSRTIYFPGPVAGAVRWTQQGGDLITFTDGSVWLTTAVLEQWSTFTKVSVTLQNGA
jgi:hypothetical protein